MSSPSVSDPSRPRVLAVIPAEARFKNMTVNQRLRALAELAEVEVLACYPDAFPKDVADRVTIHRLPFSPRLVAGPFRVLAFTADVILWSWRNRKSSRRYSLVYGTQDTSAVAGLFMRRRGSGWIVDVLDDPTLELRNAMEQRRSGKVLVLRARERIFRRLLRSADLVLTIGSRSEDPLPSLLRSEYGIHSDRIVPLRQALDVADVAATASDKETPPTRSVFYVGWVSRLRGIDTLVQAGSLLRAQGLDVELRLGGTLKGTDKEWLAEVGEKAPGLVQYLGVLPSERTRQEIQQAAVCVCPFPERRELLPVQPVKILEYMAAGRPVVASHLPGTAAVLEHGVSGLLVRPEDPESLADAMARVLTDSSLARSLGQTARDRVSDFDICRVNRRLQEALAPWL